MKPPPPQKPWREWRLATEDGYLLPEVFYCEPDAVAKRNELNAPLVYRVIRVEVRPVGKKT